MIDIPPNWHVQQLGDVAFITKLAGFEYTKHFDYSIGGSIIVIRAINVNYGELNLSNTHTIQKKVSDALPRSGLSANDIVLVYVGATIGKVAMIEHDDAYHLGPNVAKITANNSRIVPKFLFQFMQGEHYQNELYIWTNTTSQPALSMTNLRKTRVHLPSMPEQQKIAEILGTWETAVSQTEQLIAALQKRKKGLMQRLLTGAVRFKEFEEKRPWEEVFLGDIVEFIRNGYSSKQNKQGIGYPVTRIETIARGTVNFEAIGYANVELKKIEKHRLQYGDILFSHINSVKHIGKSALYSSDRELYHGMNLLMIRVNPQKILPQYAAFLLTYSEARNYFKSRAKQAVNQASLNTADVKKYKFQLPDYNEQKRIVAILNTCDNEIQLLQQQRAALQKQKKGLMQRLLTGQLRVNI